MIATKLPVINKVYDAETKTVKTTRKELAIKVDTSVYAEERWEANFPANAERETLFAYIERIVETGKTKSKVTVLSNLKALFCFIESDKIASFKEFAQMFDMSDEAHLKELCDTVDDIFKKALGASATKQKN